MTPHETPEPAMRYFLTLVVFSMIFVGCADADGQPDGSCGSSCSAPDVDEGTSAGDEIGCDYGLECLEVPALENGRLDLRYRCVIPATNSCEEPSDEDAGSSDTGNADSGADTGTDVYIEPDVMDTNADAGDSWNGDTSADASGDVMGSDTTDAESDVVCPDGTVCPGGTVCAQCQSNDTSCELGDTVCRPN